MSDGTRLSRGQATRNSRQLCRLSTTSGVIKCKFPLVRRGGFYSNIEIDGDTNSLQIVDSGAVYSIGFFLKISIPLATAGALSYTAAITASSVGFGAIEYLFAVSFAVLIIAFAFHASQTIYSRRVTINKGSICLERRFAGIRIALVNSDSKFASVTYHVATEAVSGNSNYIILLHASGEALLVGVFPDRKSMDAILDRCNTVPRRQGAILEYYRYPSPAIPWI